MYYRFKNENELLDWADYQYKDDCQFTEIITGKEYSEHPNKVIISDYTITINPNYEQEEEEKRRKEEEERKAKLKMTKRDFFLYVVQPYGVTYQALLQAISQNDTVQACYDGCNHIYRYDKVLIANIKPMLELLTGQTIDETELMAFLDVQFETHNATD